MLPMRVSPRAASPSPTLVALMPVPPPDNWGVLRPGSSLPDLEAEAWVPFGRAPTCGPWRLRPSSQPASFYAALMRAVEEGQRPCHFNVRLVPDGRVGRRLQIRRRRLLQIGQGDDILSDILLQQGRRGPVLQNLGLQRFRVGDNPMGALHIGSITKIAWDKNRTTRN